MLNKQSPLPMYYQIEEDIRQRIAKQEFLPGEAIPSERALTETYDVSRMTVRQAVNNLVMEGLLYREKGKGTFIAETKMEQPLTGLTSFTEDMKRRGLKPGNKLLSFDVKEAGSKLAAKLQIEAGERVFEVKRVRLADEVPMALETTFIPYTLMPGLTQEHIQQSFYAYVESELGLTIGRAEQAIEASLADEAEAEALAIPLHAALLGIERLTFTTDNTPFELVQSAYRADRYKFLAEITRE
ncbi:GntR family transcriptional regulator [Halobacillus sp. MO56]